MSGILVSVIVPVYNAEATLRQCMDSITGQSLQEIEIIAVDDGSDDGSVDILKEYAASDARVKIMYQDHGFAGTARNTGMDAAAGKYLVFWDSDDYFKKDALKLMYEKCEEDGADICVCGGRQYFDQEQFEAPGPRYIRKGDIPETVPYNIDTAPDRILTVTINTVWNKMFRKSFIDREGLRFKSSRNCNDVFFVECAMCCAGSITLVNKGLVVYRKSKAFGLVSSISEGIFGAIDTWIETGDALRERGKFPERSFANRALEDIIHLMSNVNDPEVFRKAFAYLQESALDRLSIKPSEDEEYYFIKWQNEASRRLRTDTADDFDRWLAFFYFSRDAATTARKRASDEKNKKTINKLTRDLETEQGKKSTLEQKLADEKARAGAEKEKLEREIRSKRDEIDKLTAKVSKAGEKIAEQDRLIAKQAGTIEKNEKTIKDIKDSVSFKIGRVITWLPRKIKRLIRGRR